MGLNEILKTIQEANDAASVSLGLLVAGLAALYLKDEITKRFGVYKSKNSEGKKYSENGKYKIQ